MYARTSTLLSLALAFAGAVNGVVIDMEGLPDTGLNTSTWTEGTLPPLSDIFTLNDIQIAAKNVLTPEFYAEYRTAALDEMCRSRKCASPMEVVLITCMKLTRRISTSGSSSGLMASASETSAT
jgi:hypothetical protein